MPLQLGTKGPSALAIRVSKMSETRIQIPSLIMGRHQGAGECVQLQNKDL